MNLGLELIGISIGISLLKQEQVDLQDQAEVQEVQVHQVAQVHQELMVQAEHRVLVEHRVQVEALDHQVQVVHQLLQPRLLYGLCCKEHIKKAMVHRLQQV